MNYLALADNGLLNTTNVLLIGYRRNFHRNLQADFVIGMHVRRDFHIRADINVLELGVYQGIDEAPRRRAHAHPGLKASRCDRHAVAYVQLCRLSIYRTKFRVLDDTRSGIVEQGVRSEVRKRHAGITTVQMREILK